MVTVSALDVFPFRHFHTKNKNIHLICHIFFVFLAVPEKKGLALSSSRQTDGQQSEPITVTFFPVDVRNPKTVI